MFKRKFPWFGIIRSDEGFTVHYGHKSVYYTDERGTAEFSYEDRILVPQSAHWIGMKPLRKVADQDLAPILERLVQALKWDKHNVQIWAPTSFESDVANNPTN